MIIIKTSWRNIWRHPLRSLAIAGAVAAGIWAGSCMMAFYFGMGEQRIRTAIEDEISHLQIHDKGFENDFGVGHPIKDAEKISTYLRSNDSVKSVVCRTVIKAMAATSHGSSGITVVGTDPADEDRTTGLRSKLIKGKYLPEGGSNKMLIGEKLLNKLKLNIGKKIILTFNDNSNNMVAGAFKVAGVFKTASAPFDERTVYVDRKTLNGLAGTPEAVYEIAILLDSSLYLETMKKKVRVLASRSEVKDWKEISPDVALIVSVTDRMLYIFMSIILFAVAFGILNTMMMSILERTRELGMLMALGMGKVRIFSMIVLETVFLSLIGCPIGILASVGTIGYFHTYGIHLSMFEKTFRSFGYEEVVYPFLPYEYYINLLAMVTVTALLASLLPSRHALKIKPGIAIRK